MIKHKRILTWSLTAVCLSLLATTCIAWPSFANDAGTGTEAYGGECRWWGTCSTHGLAIVRTVQQRIGTAFYREYLRRMIAIVQDLLEELKQEDAESAPDILNQSSKVIVDILQEYTDALPSFIRELSLENYFSEHVTGKYAIKTINNAWKTSKSSFKVDKRMNELRYDAGATYEAERIMKELPENLEAHKAREWIVMRLDAAKKFFGLDFKKGLFG